MKSGLIFFFFFFTANQAFIPFSDLSYVRSKLFLKLIFQKSLALLVSSSLHVWTVSCVHFVIGVRRQGVGLASTYPLLVPAVRSAGSQLMARYHLH